MDETPRHTALFRRGARESVPLFPHLRTLSAASSALLQVFWGICGISFIAFYNDICLYYTPKPCLSTGYSAFSYRIMRLNQIPADVRVDKARKAIALLLFTTALRSSSSALAWFLQIPANTFHPGNRSLRKAKSSPYRGAFSALERFILDIDRDAVVKFFFLCLISKCRKRHNNRRKLIHKNIIVFFI